MTKARHPIAWIGGLILLVCAAPLLAAPVRLTFLHINDVYQFMPLEGRGGFAELATLLKQERERAPGAVTTFGGDLISPSLASNLTKGAHMIELFNALGIDVAGLGNHEFDFGTGVLAERMAESRFTWIASNVLAPDDKPFGGAQRTLIREMGGFKVGFFSVVTERTAELAVDTKGARFLPALATAREAVAELRKAGAEVIVGITHLTLPEDRELARQVPGIALLLGGHDHDAYGVYENGTLIIKAGHDAQYLAVARLAAERIADKHGGTHVAVSPAEWRFEEVAGLPEDPAIAKLAAGYEKQVEEAFAKPLATLEKPMSSEEDQVRSQESALGDLFADALRAGLHADAALLNGGGLRGNRRYAAGSPLTRRDVMSEMPFGNQAVLIEVTGEQLKRALEHAVALLPEKSGRFPQLSGMRIEIDSKAAPGARIQSVRVGDAALRSEAHYRIATTDYMANGGDGFDALRTAKPLVNQSDAKLAATLVMDYLSAQGKVAPEVDGRIVVH